MNVAETEIITQQREDAAAFDQVLADVFDGVDVGLAVFDPDLKLIRANDLYYHLCGYSKETTPDGTRLQELMSRALSSQNYDPAEIDSAIATSILRLKVGGTHKFRFQTAAGKYIGVTRHRNPDGNLIETVQEITGIDAQMEGLDRLKSIAEIAHSRMMHALDAMVDGFALYDPDDRLVVYNQKYIDLNPHISDLIKPGASYEVMLREAVARGGFNLRGMDPEAFIQWNVQRHFNPGEPHELQLSSGHWVRVLDKQTEDGSIVGTRTDITELKQREIEVEKISGDLDRTTDQFDVALNNMIQGLCMFDSEQRLLLCNRQYLEMYGFSPDVVKPGMHLSDIMRYSISLGNYRDEDAQAALQARHDPDRLKKRTTIKQFLRDGRVMAVMNEPMPNGGSIATYQDITVLERHESQLVAYTKKLERSNRELQDFAYVASHDLQEPLRKIEAFSDRLLRKHGDLLPDDGKMFVDRMQNAAMRMRELINDLLGYSRITTKAKPFQQVDMQELLTDVLGDLQMALQDSQGRVEFEDLPKFDAEKTQMRQLFQNLLSNALKFRKPDVAPLIKITADKTTRTDEAGNSEDFWTFRLADNGIGFDNAYKDQIFTIFKRLHGRFEYEGTGIGLATCRKIVERHNGHIDADGVPDEGATFIIELPAKQSNQEELAQ
ncbi:MAG: PAS-domain containing protein [Pseudomonadota bacterium]